MNVCDNLGDHLVGNVYIKVHTIISSALVVPSNIFDLNSKLVSTGRRR